MTLNMSRALLMIQTETKTRIVLTLDSSLQLMKPKLDLPGVNTDSQSESDPATERTCIYSPGAAIPGGNIVMHAVRTASACGDHAAMLHLEYANGAGGSLVHLGALCAEVSCCVS